MRPWETDFLGLEGGVGERADPLCDGTSAERRDDERKSPREETPAPTTGARPGNDLELLLARRRELSADYGEAFLVFPGQCPLSGVGWTLVSPAVVADHDLNAKAARDQRSEHGYLCRWVGASSERVF